jgi:hypothetical protein
MSDTTTTSESTTIPATERLNGDVDGNGIVTINDALEILKYLAKLPSSLDAPDSKQAACIVSESAPTINDALEVLKKLAKLPNKIDGTA